MQMQVEHIAALELMQGRITEANKQMETSRTSYNSAKEESARLKAELANSKGKCKELAKGKSFTQRFNHGP